MSGEASIVSARASVMVYDDASKKWLPSGTSSGLSRVHIYHNTQNNTFRVVGRKLQDHEVVINSVILKNLKYNQATPIFHQWRENRQVYGLNFSDKGEADGFANTMLKVIDILNQAQAQVQPPRPPNQQPVYGHIGPPDEYGDMRQAQPQPQPNGWHQNGNGLHGMEPPMHHPGMAPGQPPQLHQMMGDLHLNGGMMPPATQPTYMSPHLMQNRPPNPPSAPPAPPGAVPMAPPMMSAPVQPASAVVAAPPPPPPPPGLPLNGLSNGGPPQPQPVMQVVAAPLASQNNSPPVAPPTGAAPPPPPPPPPPGLLDKPANGQPTNNLAAAIASARLKRTTSIKEDSDSTPPKAAAAPKGGNLMDEMAKTLARRRAQAERGDQNDSPAASAETNGPSKFGSPASKSEPKVNGLSPSKDDQVSSVKRNGVDEGGRHGGISDSDLERLKLEIMTDIKKELHRFKQDIIDALKSELNRR